MQKASSVLGIISNAITNNKIQDQFLNQGALTGLANYLLYGEIPTKFTIKEGSAKVITDNELLNVGKTLWENYRNSENNPRGSTENSSRIIKN